MKTDTDRFSVKSFYLFKQALTYSLIFFSQISNAKSLLVLPDLQPAYRCDEVIVYNNLDDLDGVTFDMLEPGNPNEPNPLNPTGRFVHKPLWSGFAPSSETVTPIIHTSNCIVSGDVQIGFQRRIYNDYLFEESILCQPNYQLPGDVEISATIEIYSGQTDAGCSGELTYLNSSCSSLPTQIYQDADVAGPNDIFFAKVATSDEDCGDFTISMIPVSDCIIADDCEDITEEQTLYPITDPNFAELEYECLAGCLDLATPEDQLPAGGHGCDFSSNPTVWYAIEVDDIAAQLFTTVTAEGNWTPMWSVYYGNDCDSLYNAASGNAPLCSLDDDSPDLHQTGIENLYSTYYVAVSADPNGPPIDDPNFEICTATFINVLVCLGDIDDNCEPDPSTEIKVVHREHPELEPEYDPEEGYMGPFCPGEEVDIELSFFYDATESGADWLIGFVPDFGKGWDLESIDFEAFLPTASGGNGGLGEWHEPYTGCEATIEESVPHLCTYTDEYGVLRLCNVLCESCTECDELGMDEGDILPAGYFWIQNGSNAGCVALSCRPGEQWGVGAVTSQVFWDFTLSVRDFESAEECLYNRDLQISFQTFSDGLAGCWEDPVGECLIDRKQLGPRWEVACIHEVAMLNPVEDVSLCSGNELDIELQVMSGDSLDIQVDYLVNPHIHGAKAHLFNGGSGVIDDTLYLADSICEPMELLYLALVSPETGCGVTTYDTIRVEVQPRAHFGIDTMETQCYPNTASYFLMDYLQCDTLADSLSFVWHEIGGLHSDSSSLIQIDDTYPFGNISFSVEIQAQQCNAFTDTLHLYNPSSILSNVVLMHESEENAYDGSAIAHPSGGIGPYQYLWSTGESQDELDSLTAGIYFLTITDAMACSQIDTFEILSGNCVDIEPIVNIQGNSCAGVCDATMELVNVLNVAPPWDIMWSTGDTTANLDSLCAGAYYLTISDAEGCVASFEIEFEGPDALESHIDGMDESFVGAADGEAWVNPEGGYPPYQYIWNNGENTDTINDLSPGWYFVSISDANNCSLIDSIYLNEYPCDSLQLIYDANDASCEGICNGTIILHDVLFGTPPYTYSWSNGDSAVMLNDLCMGSYEISITDSLGCTLVQEFEIKNTLEIDIQVDTILNITESGFGAILISVANKEDYHFEWNGPNGFQSQSENILNLTEEGCYSLMVTHDSTGCMKDTTICIIDETVGINTTPPLEKALHLYPNPANNSFVIQHEGIKGEELAIDLFSTAGDHIAIAQKEKSLHEASFDSNLLNAGIYLLRIQWKNEVVFRRIAIIH